MEMVVLVDEHDSKVGLMEKVEAHRGTGHLHRAISVLLYRKRDGYTEVLLQKRAGSKPLWPLFWSNTVCTHPRDHEEPIVCAVRRLQEEMGITIESRDLHFMFKLLYQATYDERYSEYELDHVFVGMWNGIPHINHDEAKDVKWMEWKDVLVEMDTSSEYTPWFKKLMAHKKIQDILEN